MKNKNTLKFAAVLLIAVAAFSSCKKEDVLATETPAESGTVLYIKAVHTDSSAIESQRILLR